MKKLECWFHSQQTISSSPFGGIKHCNPCSNKIILSFHYPYLSFHSTIFHSFLFSGQLVNCFGHNDNRRMDKDMNTCIQIRCLMCTQITCLFSVQKVTWKTFKLKSKLDFEIEAPFLSQSSILKLKIDFEIEVRFQNRSSLLEIEFLVQNGSSISKVKLHF